MKIAIVLFDGVTALDAIGPYEVFKHLPDAEITFVAERPGLQTCDSGVLRLNADASLDAVPAPDILLVPGGRGQSAQMQDGSLHEWLRQANRSATWITSVCTGSLILAAAGLLAGRRATSHWLALEELERQGAVPVCERVVFDEHFVTAAGVSAGIDMALALSARIAGDRVAQRIQLAIEYDPQPPFDAGSPDRAPTAVVAELRAHSRFA